MNKTYVIINRNGLEIIFTPTEGGFLVHCPEAAYSRCGASDRGGINFYDPEGGPFMAVGDLLAHHHPDLPRKSIKAIRQTDQGIFLDTKNED